MFKIYIDDIEVSTQYLDILAAANICMGFKCKFFVWEKKCLYYFDMKSYFFGAKKCHAAFEQ